MQRACKLEISECLPISIPRSLVLTNPVEHTHNTRGVGGREEGVQGKIQQEMGSYKTSPTSEQYN